MEHKGLFSGGVVFLAYPSHLEGFRVLNKSTYPFSICLALERAVTYEEKDDTNARNAA